MQPKSMKKHQDLIPDVRNVNKGTERGIALIENSLRKYGAGRSVLTDKHGNLIAGNKTVEAAASIGLDKIRIVESDGTELIVVKRTDIDLNSKAGRELAIADNRAGQVSLEWNVPEMEKLTTDFGIDLGSIGFTEDELASLGSIKPDEESWPEISPTTSHTIVIRYRDEDVESIQDFVGERIDLTDGKSGKKILERIKTISPAGVDR